MKTRKFYPIGIDFDGVVIDFTSTLKTYCKRVYDLDLPAIEELRSWDMGNWWRTMHPNHDDNLIDECIVDCVVNSLPSEMVPINENVRFIVDHAQYEGVVVVITARVDTFRLNQFMQMHGLENFISISKKGYPGDKATICRRMGIDAFIDDRPENCDELSKAGMTVFMQNQRHNKGHTPTGVIPVQSIQQANAVMSILDE